MMKLFFCVLLSASFSTTQASDKFLKVYKADNSKIQYIGRIDFSNPQKPRFWNPGVYIVARFKGSHCEIMLNDEVLNGNSHNYIDVVIDNNKPQHIKTKDKTNVIKVAENLSPGVHTITICKATEAGIGYVEFTGIKCQSLISPSPLPSRKIEFIGNSITCGASMDASTPCDSGAWYDHNNAYLSYGANTARNLNSQYHLTSVSGIGLMRSCCNRAVTMPLIYDKTNISENTIKWDYNRFHPDVISVCLGQNDGVQDSALFCNTYVIFIHTLRTYHPKASIVLITSPMADDKLTAALKKYITAINIYLNKEGDNNVFHYFFKKAYYHGCGGHPNAEEHKEIATELTGYIKSIKNWQ